MQQSEANLKQNALTELITNGQSYLYNGFEYLDYPVNYFETGNPYFASETWITGDVNYEGINYFKVPLLYDLTKDELVLQYFDKIAKVNLLKEKVQNFDLVGHHFINITANDNKGIPPGFYDQLYNQTLMILVQRTKNIAETVSIEGVKHHIEAIERYYVKKEGVFYRFNNEASLLKILQSQKKEITRKLKQQKIKFKKDPEKAMLIIATYYDQIRP
jgi:hypothetical protein